MEVRKLKFYVKKVRKLRFPSIREALVPLREAIVANFCMFVWC